MRCLTASKTWRRWPVRVGSALRVVLAMTNRDTIDMRCTAALHSYFAVGNIAEIAVRGLDGCAYVDTVPQSPALCTQTGAVRFTAETDRVYEATAAACTFDDPVLNRRIHIRKQGNHSTVVWNPWVAKAKRMADFGDDEYPGMVCVETTNAREDAVSLPHGGEHVLATETESESRLVQE